MSAQGAMVAKLRGTLVTIVGGALVLRQLVPPQVALVRERGLAQVALPSNLIGDLGEHDIRLPTRRTCSCLESLCLRRFPCAVNSAPHWSQAYLTPSCSVSLCLQILHEENIHRKGNGRKNCTSTCIVHTSDIYKQFGIYWPRELSRLVVI